MATAADRQLRLDIGPIDPTPAEPAEIDLVDAVLAATDGDARRAIRQLLDDADFLRDQLYIASQVMSRGMAYGWRPKYERV